MGRLGLVNGPAASKQATPTKTNKHTLPTQPRTPTHTQNKTPNPTQKQKQASNTCMMDGRSFMPVQEIK
jgi:hypothetical protein